MKTIFERKENALLLLAFASLKEYNEPTTQENISAEKARLERVISQEYLHDQNDVEYNQFILDWIQVHAEEVVYSDDWTYDVEVPDDAHEMDINVLVNKYQRKLAGSKY